MRPAIAGKIAGDLRSQPNEELESEIERQGDYIFQTGTAFGGPDPLAVQSSMIDFVFAGIRCSTGFSLQRLYIYGKLGGDNSGYSGGFTAVSGGAGLGFFRASSSGGLTKGVQGLVPNGNVTATGASVGLNILGTPTGGISATNYSKPRSLGKGLGLSNPLDFLFYLARRGC